MVQPTRLCCRAQKMFIAFFLGALLPLVVSWLAYASVAQENYALEFTSTHSILLPTNTLNGTTPLTLEVYATIESIGIVSSYGGDENQNGQAMAYYRQVGDSTWLEAHRLTVDYTARQWRGSLVYLTPDTQYEIKVEYEDVDGVSGAAPSTFVRTRPDYPSVGDGGVIWTVPTQGSLQSILNNAKPGDTIQLLSGVYRDKIALSASHSGKPSKYITIEPAPGATVIFDGSDPSVNNKGADNWIFYENSAKGSIYYTDISSWADLACADNTMLPNYVGESNGQHGVRYLLFDSGNQDWTTDFLAAPAGKAYYVCDSSGPGPIGRLYVVTYSGNDPDNNTMYIGRKDQAFYLLGTDYIRIQGLQFRYYSLSAINLTDDGISGADHNIISDNTFYGIGEWPIRLAGTPDADFVSDNLIQNNVFLQYGYRDSHWQWEVYYLQARGDVTGISLSNAGRGNVVRYNQFYNGHDAINVNNGTDDVDVYNNSISQCMDNGIEVDGNPGQNIRIWNNTISDCFASFSLQNWSGNSQGPVYIFRNVVTGGDDPLGRKDDIGGNKGYDSTQAFKVGSHSSHRGQVFIYHNTISVTRSILGQGHNLNTAGGDYFADAVSRNNIWHVTGYAIDFSTLTSVVNHDFDCDNLHDLSPFAQILIVWRPDGGPDGTGRYKDLQSFQVHTGQELNGISDNRTIFDADMKLLAGSKDIDAGCVITGFNDRGPQTFVGTAPDIGAFEFQEEAKTVYLPIIVK